MTHDDKIAALDLATEPANKTRGTNNPEGINLGGLTRNRMDGRDGYGSEVAALLTANNGTYRWDMNDPIVGKRDGMFSNIYEAMAADIHAPNGSLRHKMEAAEYRAHEARSGVSSLAKWLEEHYGVPLYRCTSAGTGNHVVVITANPDLVVDEVTGQTAIELQTKKDESAVLGQMGAAYRRLGRERGELFAKDVIVKAAAKVVNQPLPIPRHPQIK